VDDQEYYPLHEEDDVPETPPHEAAVRYARDAIAARFPDWFVTGDVCVYWERGNTKDYRAPDLFVVREPLTEPVTRVYQLWKQPPGPPLRGGAPFALEVGSRTTFRQDVGPKVKIYQDHVKAAEYAHVDLDHQRKRLWRLGPAGYREIKPEAGTRRRRVGRLRSMELGLEYDLEEGLLRVYTLDGERLRSHEESEQQLKATEQRLEQEARRRQEAEEHAAELARQLAELQARLAGDGRDES
jgi:Uma2 family endonuclease